MSSPEDFRRIALALPEAYEDLHRRRPAFRIEGRIFGLLGAGGGRALFDGLGDPEVAVVKLEREHQLNLAAAHPAALRPTEAYGHHGWTYVALDAIEPAELETVLYFAWTHVAPGRVRKQLPVRSS